MKFLRKGPVAIDPSALDVDWRTGAPQEPEALTDQISYMTIRGPVTHHTEVDENEKPIFESYDALLVKFSEVFVPQNRVVFVSGDGPGGDVAGCFDGARQLLAMKERWGGLLVWYVDGQTCSALLAWSMAADYIVVPPEGRFGSVGVIAQVESFKDQSEALKIRSKLITSGARKADGHPLNAITDDVIEAIQASVDYEANIFFEWVSERRGIPVETVRSWQAGIFHGQQAVDIGLADEVAGESAALAMVAGVELTDAPTSAEQDGNEMAARSLAASARAALGLPTPKATVHSSASSDLESIRKSLGKKAAEDSDDGRKARKALEALDDSEAEGEGGEDEDKPKKDEHEEPDGDEGSAEDETDEASAESDDDDSEASSSASAAESDDEAKKCEDEAKKAEAEAGEEDAKALSALSSSAKDSAKTAKAHMLRAKSLRASAARYRREAKTHLTVSAQNKTILSLAGAVDTLNKRVAKLGAPDPSVAAIGAKGTQGRASKGTGPNASGATNPNPLATVKNKNVLAAASFNRASTAFVDDGDGPEIALPSRAEAKAEYERTQARVAELKGGAK